MQNRSVRGQTLVEYLILVAAVCTLLTLSLDFEGADGRTAAVYLADSVRAFYRSLSYFFSLP